ncbi:hypothetical protein ASD24_24600 [Paenibacillus sp. Root52]|nr:hypothetical protein ASD24_24600 [Paenibacillus sp. Root52]
MKSTVNGKETELSVITKYHNGFETVYECVNTDGVWVAVASSMIVVNNVRTRINYSGNRAVEGVPTRSAFVTITANTELNVEVTHERLLQLANQYSVARCTNVEEVCNGTFTLTEEFVVDDKIDFEYFKKHIYSKVKNLNYTTSKRI